MSTRPSAPATPEPAVTLLADDLMTTVVRLARVLRRHAAPVVTPTQWSILTTLGRQGPLTHGELAAVEHVRPPTITAAVDRLEEDGLVARERDDHDRRVTRVVLADAGRDLLAHARRERTAEIERRLRGLTADERDALAAAAPALAHLLDDGDR